MTQVLTSLLLAATLCFGADDVARDTPTHAPRSSRSSPARFLRVAALQFRSTRDPLLNARRICERITACAADSVRTVVFPECALSGDSQERHPSFPKEGIRAALKEVGRACRTAGIYAIVGTPRFAGKKIYDSAFVFGPNGKIIASYDKIQLAEPWPTPGDHLCLFQIDGVPCSLIICHDERYPELVRLPVLAGARVIFYLSCESGLEAPRKMIPYRAQIQARAVENTVYVVQANAPANRDGTGSHGQSRLIAPDGNVIREASVYGEDTLSATLDLRRATAANARHSLDRGPLGDWWREGLKAAGLESSTLQGRSH